MPEVTNYNSKDYTIVLEETVHITGVGETMATGEKDEDFFSTSVGCQGDVCISEINNDLGTVTLTVQRTCPQRGYLNKLAKRVTPFPLWISGNGETFGGNKARLKKYPSAEVAAEAGELEYEFQILDYTYEAN